MLDEASRKTRETRRPALAQRHATDIYFPPLVSRANRRLKINSWPQRAEEQKVPAVAVGPAAVRVPEACRKPRAPGLGVPAKAEQRCPVCRDVSVEGQQVVLEGGSGS